MDLRSIIYWMEQNDGLLLKSAFGTNPLVMKKFFDTVGITCDLYTDITTLESKKVNGGVYIICQWNDQNAIMKGAHYYAVECHNGKLYSYNGYHDCYDKGELDTQTGYFKQDYTQGGVNTFSELMNQNSTIGSLICGMALHK